MRGHGHTARPKPKIALKVFILRTHSMLSASSLCEAAPLAADCHFCVFLGHEVFALCAEIRFVACPIV